jgi:hypothetical protein
MSSFYGMYFRNAAEEAQVPRLAVDGGGGSPLIQAAKFSLRNSSPEP